MPSATSIRITRWYSRPLLEWMVEIRKGLSGSLDPWATMPCNSRRRARSALGLSVCFPRLSKMSSLPLSISRSSR